MQSFTQENLLQMLSTVLGVKGLELVTLGRFIHEYLNYIEQNCSAKYLRSIKISFNHLSNHFDIQKILSHIDIRQMEAFINELKKSAPKGYRVYYRNLKAALNKAKDWGYISENPMTKIKLQKKVSNAPKFLSESELQQIINSVSDQRIKDIIIFAFYTGMRLSEIINLKWFNVNLTQRTVTVGDQNFITKSKKQRIVPMSDIVHSMLENLFPKVINISQSNVFQKSNGLAFNSDHVSKTFKKVIRKLKMDDQLHFHSLRHSFASNLAMKGVSLHELRDLLGHGSIQTTEIYSHLSIDKLRSAVDKFNINTKIN